MFHNSSHFKTFVKITPQKKVIYVEAEFCADKPIYQVICTTFNSHKANENVVFTHMEEKLPCE